MREKLRHSGPKSGDLFDELLVVMIQQGDRKALERLYLRWNDRLVRTAYRYASDPSLAQDIAQESWLSICRNIGNLREPSRFRAFAFSIVARRGADHLRERSRHPAQPQVLPPDLPVPPEQDDRIAIARAFAALPSDQRLTAHLFFVEGLSLAEIAQAQSIATGTVKSRIFHARGKLQAALGTLS